MSEAWKNGSTKAWRRVRQRVLDRNAVENDGRCQLAYEGEWQVIVRLPSGGDVPQSRRCAGVAVQVHHTLGREITGDDERYLIGACEPCNLRAGNPATAPDPPCTPRTRWAAA